MAPRRRHAPAAGETHITAARSAVVVPRPTAIEALGVSERQFARLEAAGVIRPLVRGSGRRPSKYDMSSTVRAYVEHRVGRAQSPRDRRDLAQAHYVEMKLERERGELLPREDFLRKGQRLAAAFAAKVRALPNRLARVGVASSEPEMLAAVDELLREIAQWENEDDLVRAADNA